MPKTPPGDGDEQDDTYFHKQQRPQRPAQQTYVRRKNSVADAYHSDEHPHVPKIRRASRFVEEEQLLPVLTNKLPEVDELLEEELAEEEDRTPTRRETTGKILVSPQRRRPYDVYEPPLGTRSSSTKAQRVQRAARPSGNIAARPRQETAKRHPQKQYALYGRHEKRFETR